MENFLTKDQVKIILDGAPKGSDTGKVIDSLVSQGYTLEGFNDAPVEEPVAEPVEQEKAGFFSVEGQIDRVKETFGDIKEIGTGIAEKAGERADDFGEKGLLGKVAASTGFAGDVIGEAFTGAAKIASPQSLEDKTGQVLGAVGEKVAGNEQVQKGFALLQDLKEKNPALGDALDAAANTLLLGLDVASFGGATSLTKNVTKQVGKNVARTGAAIEKGAQESTESAAKSFVRDLVSPVKTKRIKEAEVARTSEVGVGPFKRSVIAPTARELAAEEAALTIKGVSPKNTFQQNFNVIRDANIDEAVNLKKNLAENDFIFPKKELKSRLSKAKETLVDNPALVGDNQKIAEKLIKKLDKLVDEAEAKGSSLLQVRKDFDAFVQSQKGTKVFDPNTENAFSLTNREIRNTINDFLDEKAVNVAVKDSLKKQSGLFGAIDNIRPKAALEADTAIKRAFQNIATTLGTKNKLVQIVAAAAGIGGLGAAATFAPVAAVAGGLAFLGYKGGKLVLKPELRKALGKLLKESGNALKREDRDVLERILQVGSIEAIKFDE